MPKKNWSVSGRRRLADHTGGFVLLLAAGSAVAAPSLTEAITGGKASIDLRYRLETVDEDTTARDNATASTVRLRLGYETGAFYGFSAIVEAENLTALGGAAYNSGANGKAKYSLVPDPEFTEMNQAYLAYAGLPDTKLKWGRQRLTLDNHRFIGNVGWRQNEQTFDAFTAVNQSLPNTTITAGYIYNVNRVFSEESRIQPADFEMSSPILNVSYKGWSAGELTGYAYLLDFDELPGNSAKTYGLRFSGNRGFGNVKALYSAEYATQSDYQDNPSDFRNTYYLVEGGAAISGITFKLGRELLGSDQTNTGVHRGFQTPLATLHAFNGWVDMFLNTPADGLKDTYASVGTSVLGINLLAMYHDFRSDAGRNRYGKEWDVIATKSFGKEYTLAAKYGMFDTKNRAYVDTNKFWLWGEMKF